MNSDVQNCINGVSRRSFLRTLGVAGAAAATLPAAAAYAQQTAAAAPTARRGAGGQADMGDMRQMSPDTVIISSNENPLGPAPSALSAIATTATMGGRYHGEEYSKTTDVFVNLFSLPKPERSANAAPGMRGGPVSYVGLFPGSGGPLDLALIANIGPDKPLVYADPSYEQGPRAAELMKAPKFPVKLTDTYAHDVKAMVAAHPAPGAYYIVNPNNPTGTMTPKADIIWLLKNKPKGSVVIVDEAYHHFSNDESCIDLVAQDQDLIVTRTFSKIYGMAGIRAGVVVARPDLMAKINSVVPLSRSLASPSILAASAARASLLDKDLVPMRRKINADIRTETLEFMAKRGYKVIPGSQANFFMVDVGRPGREFQQAMMKEKVAIGRTWAAMPTYVRVTVGTKDEMSKFQTAFVKCMDLTPGTALGAELHMPEFHIPTELYRG